MGAVSATQRRGFEKGILRLTIDSSRDLWIKSARIALGLHFLCQAGAAIPISAGGQRTGACVRYSSRNPLELKTTLSTKRRSNLRLGRGGQRRNTSATARARRNSMNTTNPQAKKNTSEKPDEDALPLAPVKGTGPEAAGNVDKIRDILFGSQMRDYEKKFTRVEERLGRETAELREEIKRRFASLEAFVKNEFTAVADQLKAEKGERIEGDKELARDAKENVKAWEKKASQIEEQTAKALRDLRQNVLEESKRLTEEMERKHKELAVALEKEDQELRATLTDRLALADLFAEVSLRLKNEFKIPAKK